MNKKTSRFILFCLLFLLLLPLRAALAHGGGELRVANAPVGSYLVSIWTNPPQARAGQPIHTTVGVAWANDGSPALDVEVLLTLTDSEGEMVAVAEATTEQSINRLFYEADMADVPVGEYVLTVVVNGRSGNGDLAFPLSVAAPTLWPWLVGGLASAAVIWLVVRAWRNGVVVGDARRQTAVSRHRSVD